MAKVKGKDSKDNNQVLPHQEVIDKNFVFRSQLKTQEIISQVKADSSKRLGEGILGLTIHVSETYKERKKNNWWNAVTNIKGRFNTLKNTVSDDETKYYKLPEYASDYPYRKVYGIHRYQKADDTEWLWVTEQLVGITDKGSITTVPIDDSYTFVYPTVFQEERTVENNTSPRLGENITAQGVINRVPVIKSIPDYMGEIQGETIYTLRFTPENTHSLFSMRAGPIGGTRESCSLTVHKEGHNGSYTVSSIEDFVLPWDEIWNKVTAHLRVTPTDKEVKELARRLGVGTSTDDDKSGKKEEPYR